MAKREPEKFKVVMDLGQFSITVEESRPGYVQMRRFVNGNYQKKAIGRMELRDARTNKILPAATQRAKDEATAWYTQLTGDTPTDVPTPKRTSLATIGQTWKLITDPETGEYPHDSAFRKELRRSLDFAVATWGAATTWRAIDSDEWTKLLRKRLADQVRQGVTGIRSTEITISRVLTAVNWLRRKKHIPLDAALIDEHWRAEIPKFWTGLNGATSAPEPFQPRFTVKETHRLLKAAWDVDPRYGFMTALGFELRLGQVSRAMRSHLDLKANTFTVRGAGQKKGEVIALTPEQRQSAERALKGYLRALEATGRDYPLFPRGKMKGQSKGDPVASVDVTQSCERTAIRKWYRKTEAKAKVARIHGRGAYGARRIGVDSVLDQNISERGLKAFGGWKSGEVPRNIYAEKESVAGRHEAMLARAKFRGEQEVA